ncbi:MAG: 16S rRNA (cytosine(1402)-N(4))-methyltransferase RsmH [Lachnospiraceae bacterium]|nr:16S rRNA (cytosine(1402)-N(4))-methyltransferase RsmH [Lachnospiraceae bacterium]
MEGKNSPFVHTSVLLHESLEALNIKPDGIYMDGTLGGGGHSFEIAKRLGKKGRLIGLDQDEAAIKAAGNRLSSFGERITIVRSNYCQAGEVLNSLGIRRVDGILLDLGVSSYQLDNLERGFSYKYDTLLDMRMDTRQKLTARDIVNDYTESELFQIIRDYGEDKFAKNIAKHIVRARQEKTIETTGELNEIIKAAIPVKMRQAGGHPSKRTFQAIRIACNRELEVLQEALEHFMDYLNPGGRFCVITFHSLEDRMVKTAFRKSENPCICPPDFPMCFCGNHSKGKVVTRKPILPGEEELVQNKRSKSARLRVFEKGWEGTESMASM